MIQVIIKTDYSETTLQSKINMFLKNQPESIASFKVLDIKFNSSYDDNAKKMMYSAIIIYEI